MRKLIPAAFLALLFACSSKPTWKEYKVGPVAMQFPCEPSTSAAVTKCTRSDGSEYSLAIVDKGGISPEEELKQTQEYVDGIPNTTVTQRDAFPVRWRESRRTVMADCSLSYKDGKEYTFCVAYTTTEAPAITKEFFEKAKVE